MPDTNHCIIKISIPVSKKRILKDLEWRQIYLHTRCQELPINFNEVKNTTLSEFVNENFNII